METPTLQQLIPLLIPVLLVQLLLLVAGLVDLAKREHPRGPKWAWALIIIFINIIGPVVYFVWGRGEE